MWFSSTSPERRRDDGAFSEALPLELEFQRHLQLLRRAKVSGWKACGGDLSEAGVLGIQIGVPKIGMIEHVKSFSAELQVHVLGELRVFD